MIVFRWVLGKFGWFLKLVRVASGVGNCLQFLYRSKDQMRGLFPPAAECIGGEAVACRTLACLKTAWSGVTFHLLVPLWHQELIGILGILVLLHFCGVGADLLGRSILCSAGLDSPGGVKSGSTLDL